MGDPVGIPVLLVGEGARRCALPLGAVIEVMRPLPVRALPDLPPYVAGIAAIRGAPTPVVALDLLLAHPPVPPTRFVTVRTGTRPLALAVSAVEGLVRLSPDALDALPPLARSVDADRLAALALRDGELVTLLETGRLLPAEVEAALADEGAR
ncbi:MAG: chemotaxis protein CheW [Myxococcales bacterium]|nr:chemotaxis protein CheW [Myxococcales bacterium]